MTPRRALAVAALLAALSMGAGLYVQHVVGLAPCPLCVLQRVGYIVAGSFAALGALLARNPGGQLVTSGLAGLGAVGGGGVALWQNWLIAHPPEAASCGRPFEWFHEDFPLALWLPKLFRGDGDCLDTSWTLIGLLIPQWSALIFGALLLLIGWSAFGAWRARG
jgi:disulfide bond formation protein DsbB